MTGRQLVKLLEERGYRPRPSGPKTPNSWNAACPLCYREAAKDDPDGENTLSVWARSADGAGQMACWRPSCASYDDPSLLWKWFDLEEPDPPAQAGGGLGELLDDVGAFVARFVVMAPEQLVAVALWVAHTYAIDAADATPYLAITSAEKQSGKTRLLEVLELIARRVLFTSNTSPAALFRSLRSRTLAFDEVDSILGSRRGAPSDKAEELRGILNAGHRRSGVVLRMVGASMEAREFPVFGAKVLAGIGELPDTIADRSIVIRLKRKAPGEAAERFRPREARPQGAAIAARLAGWGEGAVDALAEARPELPEELSDRAADGWEPLLAIADAAGGSWPDSARRAAVALSQNVATDGKASMGVRLLADIHTLFEEAGADRFPSARLANALAALEEAPWGDLRGRPLDARGLARRLKPFEVFPRTIRMPDETTPKGYLREQFDDVWNRYLPDEGASGTPHRHNPHGESDSEGFASATSEDVWRTENPPDPASEDDCGGVAAGGGDAGDGDAPESAPAGDWQAELEPAGIGAARASDLSDDERLARWYDHGRQTDGRKTDDPQADEAPACVGCGESWRGPGSVCDACLENLEPDDDDEMSL